MFSYPCWFFHRWDKWKNCILEEHCSYGRIKNYSGQVRYCSACGKKQVRYG